MDGIETTGSVDGDVSYALDGEVALIGLERPAKRNAISDRIVLAIGAAMARATSEAKAAVIFGSGTHFSAGLDLAEHVEKPLIDAIEGSRQWHRIFATIERGTIPVVSALHGAVVGGGFELAASTHIRVADTTTYFGLPEGTRGIFVGGGGSVRIARLIGAARMGDMMLTGRTVGAEDMERWGGVSYVVPEGQSREKAVAVARRMAENAAMSNYAVMNALPRIQDMSTEDGLFLESLMASLTTETPEAKERLRAFLEKRAGKVERPDG